MIIYVYIPKYDRLNLCDVIYLYFFQCWLFGMGEME